MYGEVGTTVQQQAVGAFPEGLPAVSKLQVDCKDHCGPERYGKFLQRGTNLRFHYPYT
jgi:hypothetical protein